MRNMVAKRFGNLRRRVAQSMAACLGVLALMSLATPASAMTTIRTVAFAYDSLSGQLMQEVVEPGTPAQKLQKDYTYDTFGNTIAVTVSGADIASRTTATAYDAKGQFPVTITNALGQSETWTYDPKTGQPLTQTGPNGLTTSWQYDAFGRKTRETRPDGMRTDYSYVYCAGVNGGTAACSGYAYYVIAIPRDSGGVQIGAFTATYYDLMGRAVISDAQSLDGSHVSRTVTNYDAFGRVAKVSKPYFAPGGTAKWITNTYDVLGRVVSTLLPDGSTTTTSYDGLTTVDTNAKGQTKTTIKNQRGLVASVSDTAGKTTVFRYDPFDNLVKTTDSAGNVSTATYDTRGRKVAMHDPDMGDWTYSYDVADQLKSQTDAKGQVTTLSYDKLGRMTQRVEPGLTSNWVYDTASMGIGKLASVSTDHGYARTYAYDAKGRPSQSSTTILGDTSTIATYYDAYGRVNMVAYPSGFVAQYTYLATYGYLKEIKDANSPQVYWTANNYDAEMRPFLHTAGNGVVTTETYNANTGFLTAIQAGLSSAPNAVANFTYSYDQLSNLTARADINTGLSESFTYDGLNRLTQYQVIGGTIRGVAYDELGNITQKSDVGTYSYNASGASSVRPHAVAAIAPSGGGTVSTLYTYDANGNMLTGNGRTTTWTSFDKVATIAQGTKTVAFDYDADHNRMRQVTSGTGSSATTTLYIADAGVMTEKATGATGSVQWNDYISAGGKLVAVRFRTDDGTTSTVRTRYFTTDHLGSIAVITDEAGSVAERLSYDAWGKRRNPDGTDATGVTSQTTRGFTGHEMIDDVGLVNMNGRIYDPEIGRFMSADPFISDPTNGQDLNRYAYVHNNPLSFTDPTGYFSLGSLFKMIIAVVVVVLCFYFAPAIGAFFGVTNVVGAAAIAGAIGGAISAGITSGGDLKSMLIGAVGGAAFGALGAANIQGLGFKVMAYGITGGVTSVMGGGSFQSGFLAAGFGALAGPLVDKLSGSDVIIGSAASAVTGGIGSVLGGGKFENGAVTGAAAYATGKMLAGGSAKSQTTKEYAGDGKGRAFVGGFFDRWFGGPMYARYMDYIKTGNSASYFTWDQFDALANWVDANPNGAVIAHSYGGDTAMAVAAAGHRIQNLTTLDPVSRLGVGSWFGPSYADVRANVGNWTNINATGGSILNPSNAIAWFGGTQSGSIAGSIMAPNAAHADVSRMCSVSNGAC